MPEYDQSNLSAINSQEVGEQFGLKSLLHQEYLSEESSKGRNRPGEPAGKL